MHVGVGNLQKVVEILTGRVLYVCDAHSTDTIYLTAGKVCQAQQLLQNDETATIPAPTPMNNSEVSRIQQLEALKLRNAQLEKELADSKNSKACCIL